MKLYKIEVHERQKKDGLDTWLIEGTAIDIHGERMVKLAHGTIIPANGFFSTLAEARLEAARLIEGIGHRLLSQANTLRAEAAKAEAAA